jgi:hypothetical protein
MRKIRRFGTPVPDTEKGYASDAASETGDSGMISGFRGVFGGSRTTDEPAHRPPIQISRPIPN